MCLSASTSNYGNDKCHGNFSNALKIINDFDSDSCEILNLNFYIFGEGFWFICVKLIKLINYFTITCNL